MSLYLYGVAGLVLFYFANTARHFFANLSAARRSGLPYLITPWYALNIGWMLQMKLWLPLLHRLPERWKFPWVYLLDPEWMFKTKRRMFDHVGCDALLVVCPGKLSCFVADAEAISAISTRRNDFPKPIEIYRGVDIFGKNVVSTEGHIWRHHRKITSPPFTERNNHLVWTESLHQAQAMADAWVSRGKNTSDAVVDVAAATMRLSLHVISRAGFGRRLLWPHEEVEQNETTGLLQNGHTMTYKDALSVLLENILLQFMLPRWFLQYAPFKTTKMAFESAWNWKQYMQEMYDEAKAEVASGATTEGMDLMGSMVRGAGVVQPGSGVGKTATSAVDPEKAPSGQLLSDSEILGNAFVFILAGHETAANTLHFTMLQLALNPWSQRRLQRDLDEQFGSRSASEWSYDEDIPKLFGNMAGAVMNEGLRLFPPVVGIPKCVPKSHSPQPLTIGDRRAVIPSGTIMSLDVLGAHLDRRNWPALVDSPDASDADFDADLVAFKPERWLLDGSVKPNFHASSPQHNPSSSSSSSSTKPATQHPTSEAHHEQPTDDASLGVPTTSDTSASLYKPPRGAYVPFSEGYRACLGRRFAQVEVLATLAVFFRQYSVELAVEEVLGPAFPFAKHGVDTIVPVVTAAAAAGAPPGTETGTTRTGMGMGAEGKLGKDKVRGQPIKQDLKREEWDRAKVKVERLFTDAMGTIITLQMREGRVPVRFVRRGNERFNF